MKKTFITFITFIIFITVIPPIYAQQISLGLHPPLIESLIKPGKSILIAYKLENTGDPAIMKASVFPFRPKGDRGEIEIASQFEGPIRFSLDNSDLSLDKPFFMRPKDNKQLLLKIRVPEGAPEGDYYYTLLVTTEPSPLSPGNTGTGAQAGIGANILISVSKTGYSDVDAKISLFSVLPNLEIPFIQKKVPLFDSSDLIPVRLLVHNKGSHLLKGQGEIKLRGNFGEQSRYPLLPTNILAESQRILSASNSAKLNCDDSASTFCENNNTLVLSGFYIGKYSLATNLNFGDNTPNLYAATYFYAFPFKFTAGLLVIVAVGILIARKVKSNQ